MKTVNIYEAKSQFSKLIAAVQAGEQITIAKNGVPVADLKPHVTTLKPQLGAWKHDMDIMIPDDFNDMDPEIMDMFYNSKIFPDGNV